jgi:hypothetical protein
VDDQKKNTEEFLEEEKMIDNYCKEKKKISFKKDP